ncbi:ISWI chromatin-remodeling complex ATPase CHR11 [Camellia lanceoleosa]|uniref:ISWI chromatin-remodeling complex ATPase CHR11 n=1 Tax=Camellia lanceoleosa TaxID=1840588 RepID=A0ACC0FG39_9ERIC|nr:ISWI chromatin-remodeling complex ATPase CHR11 [Camellia lanceoleosa]
MFEVHLDCICTWLQGSCLCCIWLLLLCGMHMVVSALRIQLFCFVLFCEPICAYLDFGTYLRQIRRVVVCSYAVVLKGGNSDPRPEIDLQSGIYLVYSFGDCYDLLRLAVVQFWVSRSISWLSRFIKEEQRDEKMIERAYKKLALDALVIQQGRLAEQKNELLQMVRFGAEMVFSSKDSTITDENIDRIIAKGEEATTELDAKMKKFAEDAIKFKMDDTADL